jgi:putative peptidoglycan lipid II flippase
MLRFVFPTFFGGFLERAPSVRLLCPCWQPSKEQQGEAATRLLIDRVATVLGWALLLLSVLGVLGAAGLVWAMASGLKQEPRGFEVAVVMTRWMFPYIAFMSLVALGAGVLNTWRRFAVPAATPVLLNICMIAAAWLGAPWFKAIGLEPIYALAGGVLLGGLMQLGVQWLALKRLDLQPRLNWRWSALQQAWGDAGTQNILRLMGRPCWA